MTEEFQKMISDPRKKEKLIMISFFVSGTCGMIYAIVWIRLLYPFIGSPFLSMAIIFAVLMGGLALGSFSAGRYIDVLPGPLKVYGTLEGILGIYCLFLPWFIRGLRPLYAALYQNIRFSFSTALLLRILVSTSIFFIPATLLGAIWPAVSKGMTQGLDYESLKMGKICGVYALGGFFGTLATGFFFLPYFGAYQTLYLGVIINLINCTFILFFVKKSCKSKPEASGLEKTVVENPRKENRYGRMRRLILIGYGFSGLAVIMYIFIWLKVLVPFAGSFFSFLCLISCSFLPGFALGSLSLDRFIDKRKNLFPLLGIIELAIGLSFLGIIPLLGRFPLFMTLLVNRFSFSFLILQGAEFVLLFLILLIPSFLTGLAFPIVCKMYACKIKEIGRSMADILAVNTFGGLMGIVIGGLLVVRFGIIKGSIFAVFSHLFLGTVFLLLSPLFPVLVKGIIFLLIVSAFPIFFLFPWQVPYLKQNPSHYVHQEERGFIQKRALENDLSHQILIAHIPVLLHQQSEEILFLGQTSGITLNSIKRHPVREINVLIQKRNYFDEFCPKILNSRVRLTCEEIRHHLKFSNKKYDIIIFQPEVWPAVRPDHFTIEFFQLCRQCLRPGGIAVIGLAAQNMQREIFPSILYTWHKIFPFVNLWETELGNDYLLIGSDRKIHWNYALVNDRLKQADITSDLVKINCQDTGHDLLSCFFMGQECLSTFCRDGEIITDDHVLTDSLALKLLYQKNSKNIFKKLYPCRGKGFSLLLDQLPGKDSLEKDIKKKLMAKEKLSGVLLDFMENAPKDKILKELKEAWQLNPNDLLARALYIDTLFAMAEDYSNQKLFDLTVLSLMEIIKITPEDLKAHFLLGKAYYKKGFIDQAVAEYEKVLKSQPDNEEVHCQLGIAYLNKGWIDPSIGEFTQAIQLEPDYPEPYLYRGAAYFKKDLLFEAVEEYEKAIALKPDYADARYNLGIAYLKKGLVDEAIAEWKKVIKIRPDEINSRYNLAVAYLNYGETKESIDQLEEILRINPHFTRARSLLMTAYQMKDK